MRVIGITGPTGAGKTTALAALADLGFEIVDCDAFYYQRLREDKAFRDQLAAAFGEIFFSDGTLDRRRLAARVFGDPRELARLDGIVNPAMCAAVEQRIRNCSRKGLAIDAIHLVESGMDRLCDCTVAVTADPAVRRLRIMARDGLEGAGADARIAAQKPDSFYREVCMYCLENRGGSREEFYRESRLFFEKILKTMEE